MAQLVGEFHDQDAVLRHQADQHHQPDLRIDVERDARQEQRQDGRDKREGNGQQHDERARQAFELCDQHQEHDHQREQIGQQDVVRRFLEALRIALQDHVGIVRDRFCRQPFDLVDGVLQGCSLGNIRFHLDRAALRGAVQFGSDPLFHDLRDARHRHQRIPFGSDIEVAQIGRIGDRRRLRCQEDRHGLIADVQIDDLVPADHRPQRLGDIVEVHAQIRRPLAIDADRKLRLGRLIGDVGVRQYGGLRVDRLAQLQGRGVDLVIFRAGQGDFDVSAASAAETQCAAPARIGPRSGNFTQRSVQLLDDVRLAAIALAPIGKLRGHSHPVGIVPAHDGKGALDFAAVQIGLEDHFDLVEFAIHEVQSHAVGAGRIDLDHTAIFIGDQFAVELREQQRGQARDQHRAAHHRFPAVEAPGERGDVAVAHSRSPARQAVGSIAARAQVELGRQRGHQRQGDEG